MEPRAKRTLIIVGAIFAVISIAALIYAFFAPKLPATQNSDKTVIIDNYTDYTQHISSDSFGYLGNYLYEFIDKPEKGIYHAEIVSGSYSYAKDSWFSKFTVAVKDSDIVWDIKMQTVNNGEINGDISVMCKAGSACLSVMTRGNSSQVLQDLLPINTDDFIINRHLDNYDTLSIIYYDEAGTGKDKALEKIKSLGFKPEDYTIEYYYGGR